MPLLDPRNAPLRRAAANIHFDVIKPMVTNLTHQFPLVEEREAFGDKVLDECRNSNYHLTATLWDLIIIIVLIARWTVVGRKPSPVIDFGEQ